jgi:hypothetical protein
MHPAADEYESTLEVLRSSRAQSSTSPELRNGGSLSRTYEDYAREAMTRLRPGPSHFVG